MDSEFKSEEKLFRAIYPPEVVEMFWRKDGGVSSAAFADPNGLSVEREGDRDTDHAVNSMKSKFIGRVIYIRVKNCTEIGAVVRYLPSKSSRYHSEIHGSKKVKLLSKTQRSHLSRKAVVV